MGLLAVDATSFGVVMSADSQRVQILGGQNIPQPTGTRSRNPIVERTGGGFVGVIGSAGTEEIEGKETADWLRRFNGTWPTVDVGTFCNRLAHALTDVWKQTGLTSILEVMVAGEVSSDVQFWYVRNSDGLLAADWTHNVPAAVFKAENDLDNNYIRRDQLPGESKDDVLGRQMYSWRQGVILPAAPVFDGFGRLMSVLYSSGIDGFTTFASLDDVGHFARVRMEFLKRLCTAKYGIYAAHVTPPVAGQVHVVGVTRKGEIREYSKDRNQVATRLAGRP